MYGGATPWLVNTSSIRKISQSNETGIFYKDRDVTFLDLFNFVWTGVTSINTSISPIPTSFDNSFLGYTLFDIMNSNKPKIDSVLGL